MDLTVDWIDFSNYDAIIVPGAGGPRNGLDPLNTMPSWVTAKLDAIGKLYLNSQKSQSLSIPIILLSAGTFHKPGSLDCNGRNFQESTGMSLYLQKIGIDLNNVYEENASYDTVGNAYYLRTIHTDVREWRRLLIVVNQFHLDRLKLVFDWIFSLSSDGYQLEYAYYPDNQLEEQSTITARNQRERESYQQMLERIEQLAICTLKQFHQWFFQQHNLYRATNRRQLVMKPQQIEVTKECYASY